MRSITWSPGLGFPPFPLPLLFVSFFYFVCLASARVLPSGYLLPHKICVDHDPAYFCIPIVSPLHSSKALVLIESEGTFSSQVTMDSGFNGHFRVNSSLTSSWNFLTWISESNRLDPHLDVYIKVSGDSNFTFSLNSFCLGFGLAFLHVLFLSTIYSFTSSRPNDSVREFLISRDVPSVIQPSNSLEFGIHKFQPLEPTYSPRTDLILFSPLSSNSELIHFPVEVVSPLGYPSQPLLGIPSGLVRVSFYKYRIFLFSWSDSHLLVVELVASCCSSNLTFWFHVNSLGFFPPVYYQVIMGTFCVGYFNNLSFPFPLHESKGLMESDVPVMGGSFVRCPAIELIPLVGPEVSPFSYVSYIKLVFLITVMISFGFSLFEIIYYYSFFSLTLFLLVGSNYFLSFYYTFVYKKYVEAFNLYTGWCFPLAVSSSTLQCLISWVCYLPLPLQFLFCGLPLVSGSDGSGSPPPMTLYRPIISPYAPYSLVIWLTFGIVMPLILPFIKKRRLLYHGLYYSNIGLPAMASVAGFDYGALVDYLLGIPAAPNIMRNSNESADGVYLNQSASSSIPYALVCLFALLVFFVTCVFLYIVSCALDKPSKEEPTSSSPQVQKIVINHLGSPIVFRRSTLRSRRHLFISAVIPKIFQKKSPK